MPTAMVDPAERQTVYHGGCHCGALRFTVAAGPGPYDVDTCNCSICSKTAYLHLLVPAAALTLIRGAEMLREYRFNTETARHLFCARCGVKPYYVPRSHPHGYSVNVRCLEHFPLEDTRMSAFDGRHFEQHVDALRASRAPISGQS